jgi:hypothetical protein
MLANLQEATKELDTVRYATPKKDDAPLTTQRATSTGNWVTWGQTIDNGALKEHPPKASSSPSTKNYSKSSNIADYESWLEYLVSDNATARQQNSIKLTSSSHGFASVPNSHAKVGNVRVSTRPSPATNYNNHQGVQLPAVASKWSPYVGGKQKHSTIASPSPAPTPAHRPATSTLQARSPTPLPLSTLLQPIGKLSAEPAKQVRGRRAESTLSLANLTAVFASALKDDGSDGVVIPSSVSDPADNAAAAVLTSVSNEQQPRRKSKKHHPQSKPEKWEERAGKVRCVEGAQ